MVVYKISGHGRVKQWKVVDVSKVPEPWATRLVERGYTDRRSTQSAIASYGALADELGINTTTISEAVTGKRQPTVETVLLLMEKLGNDVAGWLGMEEHGDWTPPTEVVLLSPRQRRALEELIRSMTERESGRGATSTSVTAIRTGPYDEDLDQLPPDDEDLPPLTGGLTAEEAARREDAEGPSS